MKLFLFITCFAAINCFGLDTLCTHPLYPPIVYKKGEYHFYKYTGKYIPENMLHSFKILATCGDETLISFMKKSEEEVLKDGMFKRGYRIRKEFGLEGYSSFTGYFHKQGIFYPYAMKTYILLCFHQYLKKEKIRWHANKQVSLKNNREINKSWKRRLNYVFTPVILPEAPAAIVNPVFLDPVEEEFYSR